MNRLRIRVLAALVTFVLGVTASVMWYPNRTPTPKSQPPTPETRSQKYAFEEINSVTRLADQNELRKVQFVKGDFEVRIWRGFALIPLEGLILRRVGGEWSALHLKADIEMDPTWVAAKNLQSPKSGWADCWQRLVDAEILTLPDSSELDCGGPGLDVGAYVIETNVNGVYRTYAYSNPNWSKCHQSQKILMMDEVFREEFEVSSKPKH